MRLSRTITLRPAGRTVVTTGVGVAACTAVAVVVAGCGAGDDAAGAGTPAQEPLQADGQSAPDTVEPVAAVPAVCPLTAADVTTALGIDVVEGTATCSFTSSSSTYAEVYYETVSTDVFAADEPTAVSGIGDKAYLGPSKELYVLSGDLSFSIHVLASEISSGIDGNAVQQELARLVIDRQR